MPSGIPKMPYYESAFRRWPQALDFHNELIGAQRCNLCVGSSAGHFSKTEAVKKPRIKIVTIVTLPVVQIPEAKFCNNYSVIITLLCLFCHTSPLVLSMT